MNRNEKARERRENGCSRGLCVVQKSDENKHGWCGTLVAKFPRLFLAPTETNQFLEPKIPNTTGSTSR